MRKKRVCLWGLQLIRVASTVLTVIGISVMAPFSMYSVVFLCAAAYDAPSLSAGLLLGYFVVFLLSLIFLIFKKTTMLGIISFAVIVLSDLCTVVLSAFLGSNQYFWVGVPLCVIELLFFTMCFREIYGKSTPTVPTQRSEDDA